MTFAAEEAGQILSQDARGRVLVSRERRESLLEEYDRSGMSGVKFAQYVGIKYSTLAYWLQSRRRRRRREKLLLKAGAGPRAARATGGWIEAVVEEAQRLGCRQEPYGFTLPETPTAQISSAGEAALAAELLGRLGAKR